MPYTRTRIHFKDRSRCTKTYSIFYGVGSKYNRTYTTTGTRTVLGFWQKTLDNPGRRLPAVKEAEVTRLEKGVDPSWYFNALDSKSISSDFGVVRMEGAVTVPSFKSTKPTQNYTTTYEGVNPLIWGNAPVEVENWVVTPDVLEVVGDRANFVLTKALAKLNEPQIDYAVPLAELRETLKFLVSPVKSLLRLNQKRNLLDSTWAITRRGGIRFVNHPDRSIKDKLKRRSWGKDLRDAPSHISDWWLSYRYGVEPLVRDCMGALEHAWHGIGHTDGIFTKRARLVEKKAWAVDSGCGVEPLVLTYRDEIKITDTHRAHVFARRRVLGGYIEQMLDMGFNPFAAPALAWELVPLSFVLDRFINVGDWLQSLAFRPDTSYLCNTVSRQYKIEVTRFAKSLTHAGYNIPPEQLGKHVYQFDSYCRMKDRTLPATPVFNHRPLSIAQWADHLSILWQRMPKFVRD